MRGSEPWNKGSEIDFSTRHYFISNAAAYRKLIWLSARKYTHNNTTMSFVLHSARQLTVAAHTITINEIVTHRRQMLLKHNAAARMDE